MKTQNLIILGALISVVCFGATVGAKLICNPDATVTWIALLVLFSVGCGWGVFHPVNGGDDVLALAIAMIAPVVLVRMMSQLPGQSHWVTYPLMFVACLPSAGGALLGLGYYRQERGVA